MLAELAIEDLAVVATQRLTFGTGLTVITGESGAGKSLILRAIDLAAGGRGDPALVRTGREALRVVLGVRVGGEQHAVVREVRRDGRGGATIDAKACRLSDLRDFMAPWLGIGRQGDAYRLRQAGPLGWLDRLESVAPALAEVAACAERVLRVRDELAALGAADPEVRARRADYLRYALAEIEAAGVRAGERESLRQERDRLRSIGRLREAVVGARERLMPEGEGVGAYELLGGAAQSMAPLAALDPALEEIGREIAVLADGCRDQARALGRALEALVADPAREEEVGARLDRLSELDRKYGGDEAAVLAFAAAAHQELGRLEGDEGRRAELEAREAALETAWAEAARRLSQVRTEAARVLERDAAAELARLALADARLYLRVVPDPAAPVAPVGMDRLECLFAADAGAPLLDLGEVASGGEASRVLLALEAALAKGRPGGSWLFDEVEAGVGGAAAWNVAASLLSLARAGQVIVVSHLAPVAAVADAHFAVVKGANAAGEPASAVARVTGEARVAEIVRMLSGSGPAAERHARDILARGRALASEAGPPPVDLSASG